MSDTNTTQNYISSEEKDDALYVEIENLSMSLVYELIKIHRWDPKVIQSCFNERLIGNFSRDKIIHDIEKLNHLLPKPSNPKETVVKDLITNIEKLSTKELGVGMTYAINGSSSDHLNLWGDRARAVIWILQNSEKLVEALKDKDL